MIKRKTNKFESRKLTLEERINRLERILYNERSLHRTDELLKGVIGKVNATKEDRDEVIELLKSKLNIDDERSVYIDSGKFKFHFTFFTKDDINEAKKNIKPNLSPKAQTNIYFLEIEDTPDNKIVVSLQKNIAVYGYKEINIEPRRLGYGDKVNTIDQLTGLTLVNKEHLVKKALSLLTDNGINISNIVSAMDGDDAMEDVVSSAKHALFLNIIDRLEDTQGLKNIEWYRNKNEIVGEFHMDDAYSETGNWRIVYDLGDSGFMYVYHITEHDYKYKAYGHEYDADEIAKYLKKAISISIKQPEKMRAGHN